MGNPKTAKKSKNEIHSNRVLNLTDDTLAAPPVYQAKNETAKNSLMAALSARAATTNGFEKETAEVAVKNLPVEAVVAKSKIEAVEISSEAPKVIHPKKEFPKQIL